MYNHTRTSGDDRPLTAAACFALVATAIAVSTASFWLKGWQVGLVLTPPLAAASWLLSQSVPRFSEAMERRHYVTAGLTVVMGLVCLAIEASLVDHGAAYLNAGVEAVPAWIVGPAAWGLGLFNVFASYTYNRELKLRQKPETSAGKLLAFKRWNRAA